MNDKNKDQTKIINLREGQIYPNILKIPKNTSSTQNTTNNETKNSDNKK